jgi:hypothetical protein
MSATSAAGEQAGRIVIVTIGPERAAELDRLAQDLKRDATELAKEFLETEIEAEHGLRFGPVLRKYIYR